MILVSDLAALLRRFSPMKVLMRPFEQLGESSGEIPCQIVGGHGDGPCEGLVIAVGVLNGEPDRVCACGGEILRGVEGAIALRHRLCSYLRPVDAPRCRAVARGLLVGSIGGRPVEFDLDGRAVHHGECPRGQLIDDTD